MRMLNRAIEDAAAFEDFTRKLTEQLGTRPEPPPPTIDTQAARRERMRQQEAQAKRLAKARR